MRKALSRRGKMGEPMRVYVFHGIRVPTELFRPYRTQFRAYAARDVSTVSNALSNLRGSRYFDRIERSSSLRGSETGRASVDIDALCAANPRLDVAPLTMGSGDLLPDFYLAHRPDRGGYDVFIPASHLSRSGLTGAPLPLSPVIDAALQVARTMQAPDAPVPQYEKMAIEVARRVGIERPEIALWIVVDAPPPTASK